MHEEALTVRANELFPRLGRFKGFSLVGGTAIALQIGHRVSVDFDLFTYERLSPTLLQQVKRTFHDATVQVSYRTTEQLNLLVDGIKMTFFSFPYPVVDRQKSYRGVFLLSLQELAAMKAFAIGKRLAYKDYVDWYFLLHGKHVTLRRILAIAQKKFGNDFNDRLFLSQLTSLSDVPTQKIFFLKKEIPRATIERFLENIVRTLVLT